MEEEGNAYAHRARQIVESNSYMVVCTADSKGEPWGAPVFFAADQKYTKLYFISAIDSLHAKNVESNPEVSIVIFDSSSRIGSSEGVQMEGVASEVGKGEIAEAISAYSARLLEKSSSSPTYSPEQYLDPSEFRFFKVQPRKIFVTGEDRRTEVEID